MRCEGQSWEDHTWRQEAGGHLSCDDCGVLGRQSEHCVPIIVEMILCVECEAPATSFEGDRALCATHSSSTPVVVSMPSKEHRTAC